ncbi:hypothetical protein AU14_17555 [Marinobacter similis]|uniref:Uncharacterized protein n=1 Tax=Marinobacter similis TaxID=1420916 RepID=W5YME9_9GAMM|nr:hypothetical protein AU14_17555 [Marinobacter similis]
MDERREQLVAQAHRLFNQASEMVQRKMLERL